MNASTTQPARNDGWRRDGEYALVHPSGWSIARYRIDGEWTYLLWHGNETQGRFTTADEAKRKHIELSVWTPAMSAPDIGR